MKRLTAIITVIFLLSPLAAFATVSVTTNRIQYSCNGSTTTYSYTFKVFEDDDLTATVASSAGTETTLALNTDYTVTGAGSSGGNVVLTAGTKCPDGSTLTITRDIDLTQETDYEDGGGLSADTLESNVDRLTLISQDQQEKLDRTFSVAKSSTLSGLTVPVSAGRAIGWNSGGTALSTYATTGVSAPEIYSLNTDFSCDLAAAVAAIPAESLRLDCPYQLSDGESLTIPATMHLHQEAGGNVISGTAGGSTETLTLNGSWDDVSFQWIDDTNLTLAGAPNMPHMRPEWFGAVAGDSSDDYPAITTAITLAGNGGEVKFLKGIYYTDTEIAAEDLRGLTLTGAAGQYGWSGTRIIARHTGRSTLSLRGSIYCRLNNLSIEGDSSTYPKCGLLLGRSSSASAGLHVFDNVHVEGSFSVAGVYNIASEQNTWIAPHIQPAVSPIAGLFMAPSDIHSLGGLTASSMEKNDFFGGTIGNSDNTAGSTAIYIDCNASTGHNHFYGTFLTKNGGDSFITVRYGAIDGKNTTFPILFDNVSGEHNTAAPTTGLHIISSGSSLVLAGLTANNLRLQTPGTNHILMDGSGSGILVGARISTPFNASPSIAAVFEKLQGCDLSLNTESSITIASLAGSRLLSNVAAPTITTDVGGNTVIRQSGTIYKYAKATNNLALTIVAPTVSGAGTLAVDASSGNFQSVAVTTTSAFTIGNPTNAVSGQTITFQIRNQSGGALGTITWDTLYMLASFTNPANGFNRSITFWYNGSKWIEISRTSADVANA